MSRIRVCPGMDSRKNKRAVHPVLQRDTGVRPGMDFHKNGGVYMAVELTCIICPVGCRLVAETGEDGKVLDVTGNGCKRGEAYAKSELTHPVRTLTSTVIIAGARYRRLPVITSAPVAKEALFDVMKALDGIRVQAPVAKGEVILRDVCGLGVDILAERSMETYGNSGML